MNRDIIPGSFRDPSGFLFVHDGSLFRQVNTSYQDDYDHLIESGLYESVTDSGLMIRHEEAGTDLARTENVYKILKPEPIPFISYPYEWCFSELKDAALVTLQLQMTALDFGMTLKDASAYNVQFLRGKPVLIDTLSFEKYREGQAWAAYRQFCQHFLAPLALMSLKDIRLSQLLRTYIDGVPLDLASSLLPSRTRLTFSLLSHIHLHARSQRHFADRPVDVRRRRMSRASFLGLIDNLESAVKKLKWRPEGTDWAHYYDDTAYSQEALQEKQQLVAQFLDQLNPSVAWDLGANVGLFSRLASDRGVLTISFDMDPACVERNYLEAVKNQEPNILPLLLDLTNPSPDIGWANQERMSLLQRGPADMVLCLALIHHLAISNNLPFGMIAEFLNTICDSLIIEFVPKSDPQVQRLLSTREDIFTDYTERAFEDALRQYFTKRASAPIAHTGRTLYLMSRR